jgi:DNA processing protein
VAGRLIDACDGCLRRARLLTHLAPRIAGLLDRPSRRPRGLLALSDQRLIAAVLGGHDAEVRGWLEAFDAGAEREGLAAAGASAACAHSSVYPGVLSALTDPPALLFACGDLGSLASLDDRPAVALVGTRRASPYGLEMAHRLGRELGAAGVPVVSGLALGVDAAAHRGSLDGGGAPIAVLAGGPETPYPRRNRGLYARVRETGVVVSEMPPGQRPFRWSFPARNRIMAGLAAMTVVVEAAEPSGSLITAEFARDLGRGVGAVPGRVTSRVAAGSNRLLQDGAALVMRAEDVLDELYGVGSRPAPPPPPARPEPAELPLRAVLAAVEAGESATGIARAAGMGAGEVRAALGRLEAEGFVVRDALGAYERRA